ARRGPAPPPRRGVGVDGERLPPLPRLSPAAGRPRRVQRQVHERSDGAARRLVRHGALPPAPHLPQLLPTREALAAHGGAPRRRRRRRRPPAPLRPRRRDAMTARWHAVDPTRTPAPERARR